MVIAIAIAIAIAVAIAIAIAIAIAVAIAVAIAIAIAKPAPWSLLRRRGESHPWPLRVAPHPLRLHLPTICPKRIR